MLVVLSDTHSRDGDPLPPAIWAVVRDADCVVHAGDFVSVPALDAIEAAARDLVAVHGNVDAPGVRSRLPTEVTFEYAGVDVAVVHRKGSDTALELFGRETDADLVISGHTHRPRVLDTGRVVLLNPGSPTQPRGHRAGYAVLEPDRDGLRGELRDPDGTVAGRFTVTRER